MPEETPMEIVLNPDQMARSQAAVVARDLVVEKKPMGGQTVDHMALIDVANWIITGEWTEDEDEDEVELPRATPVPRFQWPAAAQGLRFPGGINIPADGSPAFYTEADDSPEDSESPAPVDPQATTPSTIPDR